MRHYSVTLLRMERPTQEKKGLVEWVGILRATGVSCATVERRPLPKSARGLGMNRKRVHSNVRHVN